MFNYWLNILSISAVMGISPLETVPDMLSNHNFDPRFFYYS